MVLSSLPITGQRQTGIVALILLSILVLVFATAMIAGVSLNAIKFRKGSDTARALQQAQQALIAYSVVQAVKGSLPCPDTDTPRDGRENRNVTQCSANIGGLPYRDLALPPLRDASASALWYAVAPGYTDTGGVLRHNSSLNGQYRLDAAPVAAVVIAPGSALGGQQRDQLSPANYLEGENANASVDTYAQANSDTQNDVLTGLPSTAFWHVNERAVLSQLATLLRAYRSACGEYPWAADFAPAADDSIANRQQGSPPLDSALPTNWDSGCALGLRPAAELVNHWRNQIYYAFCTQAQGSCLTVVGDAPQNASAILLAPGTSLPSQDRSTSGLDTFFEDENRSGLSPFKGLAAKNINGTFNDYLHIVSP